MNRLTYSLRYPRVLLESIRVCGHSRNANCVLRVCRQNPQKCAVDDFPSEAQEFASLALWW